MDWPTTSPQWPDLEVRPLEEADYPAVCAIRNVTLSEPLTPDVLRARDRGWDPTWFQARWIVLLHGEAIAIVQISQNEAYQPNRYFMLLDVAPAWRKRGLGTMLADGVEQIARAKGGAQILTTHRDDLPDSTRFLKNRKFGFHQHLVNSALQTERLDEADIRAQIDALSAQGIVLRTWEEIGESEANRRALFEVFSVSDRDTPGVEDWGPLNFEGFEGDFFVPDRFHPRTLIVAIEGDRMVGLSSVCPVEGGQWSTAYTGTLPGYRGRGVGRAAKGLAVLNAKRVGAKWIQTQNDTRNQPMLAINTALGYEPQFGWIYVKKQLEEESR
jgi:GNAT superfamily N-acetyltransferase